MLQKTYTPRWFRAIFRTTALFIGRFFGKHLMRKNTWITSKDQGNRQKPRILCMQTRKYHSAYSASAEPILVPPNQRGPVVQRWQAWTSWAIWKCRSRSNNNALQSIRRYSEIEWMTVTGINDNKGRTARRSPWIMSESCKVFKPRAMSRIWNDQFRGTMNVAKSKGTNKCNHLIFVPQDVTWQRGEISFCKWRNK